jgi:dCMP deaminase
MDRWDAFFLQQALLNARMSKDPDTQVGAVLVGPDLEVRSAGFNGFPRGIADTAERLTNRELKMSLMVHAEMNACLNAARIGTATKGCTIYFVATDDSGMVWGGPPCTRCTCELIQAGILAAVSPPRKTTPSKWHQDLAFAQTLLTEAGILYRQVAFNPLAAL